MADANKRVVASVSKFVHLGGEHAAFLGLVGAGVAALVSGGVYVANLKSHAAMNQLINEKRVAELEKDMAIMQERYEQKIAVVENRVSDVCIYVIILLRVLHDDIRHLVYSGPLSWTFPMTIWQLSLDVALCLEIPIKYIMHLVKSNHLILAEFYEIPNVQRLVDDFRCLSW